MPLVLTVLKRVLATCQIRCLCILWRNGLWWFFLWLLLVGCADQELPDGLFKAVLRFPGEAHSSSLNQFGYFSFSKLNDASARFVLACNAFASAGGVCNVVQQDFYTILPGREIIFVVEVSSSTVLLLLLLLSVVVVILRKLSCSDRCYRRSRWCLSCILVIQKRSV